MKKIYLLAAAAALFAACSSDKVSLEPQQQPAQLEEGAVGFDAYTQRAITRGGWAGSLNTSTLQSFGDPTPKGGFGVFGYYTDNNEYDQRSTPNFFYNQLVYWKSSAPTGWTYEPVKYWPNEYGSNAVSEDQDKVTYFAYAPWIEVIQTSGKLADTRDDAEEWGITGMTRNSNQGDPILKYIAQFSKKRSVDLCWGVADYDDGIWPITEKSKTQTIANGNPWIDVERPANSNQRVKFTFKHALAQMRINIDAFVDATNNTTNDLDPLTRIWVREVTFKGFAMKGSLNLNNEDPGKPKWLDYGGQNELVSEAVTVYDGRKDGKEGVAGAVATNEKVLGLNPILVQDGVYAGYDWEHANPVVSDPDKQTVYNGAALKVYGINANGVPQTNEPTYDRAGVTKTTVPLFDQYEVTGPTNANCTVTLPDVLENYPFHVIPTDEPFEVEIVYDVETVSENLAQNLSDGQTKGTSIENRIRKEITFYPNDDASKAVRKLEPGHSYTLNLHLGMNSVKFDAAVTEWIDVQEQDVDLPLNTPKYPVETPANVTIPFKGDYTFAITGFDGGESMNATNTQFLQKKDHGNPLGDGKLKGWNGTSVDTEWSLDKAMNAANTNGIAIQTLTIYPNPNTTNQIQKVQWQGSQSGKNLVMTITQQAHPLFLNITGFANNSNNQGEITITRNDDESHKTQNHWNAETGWLCKGEADNGATLDQVTDMPLPTSGDNFIEVYRNGTRLTWTKETGTSITGSKFNMPNTSTTGDNVTNKITIGDKLRAGDVIKVVLKTGDAPEETVTATVEADAYFPYLSRTLTYKATGDDYEGFRPTIKAGTSPAITYTASPDGIVTLAPTSSGYTIKTVDVGDVIIKATWSSSNPLALTEDSYKLTISPQATHIDWATATSNHITNKNVITNGTEILSSDELKALFKVVGIDDGTAVGSISGVTGPTSGELVIDGGALKVGSSDITLGTDYTIELTVTGTGTTQYSAPAGTPFTLTYTPTNP